MVRGVLALVMAGVLMADAAATAATTAAKTTLAIKGMTCGGCVATVKLQLKRTEGVVDYEVSLEKAEAEVTYDPARTTPGKIAESVSRTGFEASVKDPAGHGNQAQAGVAAMESKECCDGDLCQRDCCRSAKRSTTSTPDGEAMS